MEAVNVLREEGYPIGLIRMRFIRPFPDEEIYGILNGSKGVIVFDRAISFGSLGPLYLDVAANLTKYTRKLPYMRNIIAGVGGVNVTHKDFYELVKTTIDDLEKGVEPPVFTWYHRR